MSHLLITSETTNDEIQLNFNNDAKNELQSRSQFCKHVTVVGKARTGKSFLLNAIAGQNSKFAVGNGSVVTKGVHISNETFQLSGESSIRMIDVEGMGEESDNYDYSLALPILAASDLILFNFKGQPRSNDVIKELNLLVHIFKRVLENKNNKTAVDEQKSKYLFPPIILVLRDWTYAESYTPEKYLQDIFNSKDPSVRDIRRCVESIDVCFLPPPADHKTISHYPELPLWSMNKEFSEDLQGLKRQMGVYLSEPTSTLLASRLSTTNVFLNTVECVCNQLNDSGVQIPDVMDAIERNELDLAVAAINAYLEDMFSIHLPIATEDLERLLDTKHVAALDCFREETKHLTSSRQKKMRDEEYVKFRESIVKDEREKMRENDDLIEAELAREAERLLQQFRVGMERFRWSDNQREVKREADRQRGLFVEGLVNVARKKNFLGVPPRYKIDEKTARTLLPIDGHLKQFDLYVASEIKECQIRIERQNAAKSETQLKKVREEAEEYKKKLANAEGGTKKLDKEMKELLSRRDKCNAMGTSGHKDCGETRRGSSIEYSGDIIGSTVFSPGGYQAESSSRSSFGTSGRSFPGTPAESISAKGHELFTGPRGGIFHVSSGGNRVYHPTAATPASSATSSYTKSVPSFGGYQATPSYQVAPSSYSSFGMSGTSFSGTATGSFSARGHELFQGSRGGIYHMSSGGNRVYH